MVVIFENSSVVNLLKQLDDKFCNDELTMQAAFEEVCTFTLVFTRDIVHHRVLLSIMV